MKVTVLNPATGTIHVHRAGCADLTRRTGGAGGVRWDVTVASRRDVIENIYPPDEFDYDPDTEWQNFTGDVRFLPCTDELDDVAEPADRDLQIRDVHDPIGEVVRDHLGALGVAAIHHRPLIDALCAVVDPLIQRALAQGERTTRTD